jgi:hypothetical protein
MTAEAREALRLLLTVAGWITVGASIYAVYYALFVLK